MYKYVLLESEWVLELALCVIRYLHKKSPLLLYKGLLFY